MKSVKERVGWFVKGLVENVKRGVLGLMGEVRVKRHPMWIEIKPEGNEVKGRELRKAMELVKPGDVVARRYRGMVSSWFIPGRYSHTGIYVGEGLVIHAVERGVVKTDLLDYLMCDGYAILRAKRGGEGADEREGESEACEGIEERETIAERAVRLAKRSVGKKYDYDFEISEGYEDAEEERKRTKRVYCHELVRSCYPGLEIEAVKPELWNGMIRSEKRQYLWESFIESEEFEVVYDTEFSEARAG